MPGIDPFKAAELITLNYFPNCHGALLAGSVVRGEATKTSDLDMVIFDQNLKSAYRESFIEFGWNIEVFVHNLSSYKDFFKSDCERARPSLPNMVKEGIVLKDCGIMEAIKQEAKDLLEMGPEEWSAETIRIKRYFITDVLDDFIGCTKRTEEIFIANTLAELVSEFVLRTNRQWIGTSKWVVRALRNYDRKFADQFVEAFDIYYKTGDKNKIILMVDNILKPFGGRLFQGFSIGKKSL